MYILHVMITPSSSGKYSLSMVGPKIDKIAAAKQKAAKFSMVALNIRPQRQQVAIMKVRIPLLLSEWSGGRQAEVLTSALDAAQMNLSI